MEDVFSPGWLILVIVPVAVLGGLALNYPRARRWQKKAESHGQVHCRACGFVGVLDVRSLSGRDTSSSNLVLVCPKCESHDWFVPDDEKAP